ncbi:cysteine desulfurase [Marivibrio halodurans]|uniref:Cysteine desulfurase n=1 Tax=Marivibrio halodurans TaxID=2039722 RepID=A0A8J7S1T3_9PROT|nr:cysteine desulfurase family protein [Marivibrio halodurans]MBP5857023.1 cysteine desulfurase [Marivibrio halodurans]
MTRDAVYLDYNATAPCRPAARAAVAEALAMGGNASSVHGAGRAARAAIERARASVAALAGAEPADLIFTSGATEADNLALRGTGAGHVLVSAVEHDAVTAARPDAGTIPVDGEGRVDLDALDRLLGTVGTGGDGILVSVMAVNNETGAIQPVAAVAERVHAVGGLLHVDAAQAAGRIALAPIWDVADLMSLSAHKMGGPPGVGALLARAAVPLRADSLGGGQERRRRAGTENLPGIAGFGATADELAGGWREESARIAALRDDMEARLAAIAPAAVVAARSAPRAGNVSCIALPGLAAEKQVMALDLAGVAVSAGSACSSGKVTRSRVLDAMGWPPALAGAAIRVSLGWASGEADVDAFLAAYEKLARKAEAA